ncbi:MAG: hypothetical protein ACLFUF_05650 [Opitutales bacterium]
MQREKAMERREYDAGALMREHPPHWEHPNKETVFGIACSSGDPFEGEVNYARWQAERVSDMLEDTAGFSVREGVFDYLASEDPNAVDWWLNFADPDLFCAYGSALMAQDELQVAEHPVLGAVREALVEEDAEHFTVARGGGPSPVTVTGAQRRCIIDTRPNPEIGCPGGLYGNAFSRASAAQVRAATRALSPPTVSNILAMAAPEGGFGEYSRSELEDILRTAYIGFVAASSESKRLRGEAARPIVHTGFWGCGAFGGNRSLMTILQSLAGDLAGVELVFWTFDEEGAGIAREARGSYEALRAKSTNVRDIIEALALTGFKWGVSDGN